LLPGKANAVRNVRSVPAEAHHDLFAGTACTWVAYGKLFFILALTDQAVRLVSLRTASQLSVLPGSNATFSPAAQYLATTEPAGLRLWSLPR
jgi:hypothetical protein